MIKIITKVILTVIFIPIFLLFLLAITLRFQLLNSSFWENSFASGQVYSKLSLYINKNLEFQTIAEGGKASDVKVLTDLISPENLQDTIIQNTKNVLLYANGRAKEIVVYIPVSKIPKALLSKNFNVVKEQTNLTDLIKEFNLNGISASQIKMVSHAGSAAWIALLFITSLTVLIPFLLLLTTTPGKRLDAPGVTLIISGSISLLIVFLGNVISANWTKSVVRSSDSVDSLVGIIAPPVLEHVMKTWLLIAIFAIAMGIVLIFLRKSYDKIQK